MRTTDLSTLKNKIKPKNEYSLKAKSPISRIPKSCRISQSESKIPHKKGLKPSITINSNDDNNINSKDKSSVKSPVVSAINSKNSVDKTSNSNLVSPKSKIPFSIKSPHYKSVKSHFNFESSLSPSSSNTGNSSNTLNEQKSGKSNLSIETPKQISNDKVIKKSLIKETIEKTPIITSQESQNSIKKSPEKTPIITSQESQNYIKKSPEKTPTQSDESSLLKTSKMIEAKLKRSPEKTNKTSDIDILDPKTTGMSLLHSLIKTDEEYFEIYKRDDDNKDKENKELLEYKEKYENCQDTINKLQQQITTQNKKILENESKNRENSELLVYADKKMSELSENIEKLTNELNSYQEKCKLYENELSECKKEYQKSLDDNKV